MRPVGLVLLALFVGGATAQAEAPPTVKTFKDYRIEIDPVPPPAANADSPRPHQELRILRDGTVLARVANERVDLYGGDLTDLDRKDKRNVVPVLGADVTGTGMPVAVVETYDGGAHCCTTLQLFALGPDFRPLGAIHGGNYPVRFRRMKGTPGLVAVIYDETFAYWMASFADSVAPEVLLAYDPQADDFRFNAALMRRPPPSAKALKAEADRVRRDPAWKRKGDDNVPPALWDRMLALIYSGQAPLARDFLERAWAGKADDRAGFWHDLVLCQLRRSIYWPNVAALNGWAPDKPAADCPTD